jgi:hypothetical protein
MCGREICISSTVWNIFLRKASSSNLYASNWQAERLSILRTLLFANGFSPGIQEGGSAEVPSAFIYYLEQGCPTSNSRRATSLRIYELGDLNQYDHNT